MSQDQIVENLGYFGVPLLLILGGLGVPIPEEGPIVLAAVLARRGALWGPGAFLSCLVGVIVGDFVVYALGYFYGERVLQFKLTRSFLTRQREEQLKGYFHRHGFKILILGRFAVGFRTAAYLTAGILRLPAGRLLLMDLVAATLSTSLMFGLGYIFAQHITQLIQAAEHALAGILVGLAIGVSLFLYIRGRRRSARRVGPPVIEGDIAPLPETTSGTNPVAPTVTEPEPGPAPVVAEEVVAPPPELVTAGTAP